MAYSVKIIVYTVDDPKVERSVRAAMNVGGATILEFSTKEAANGELELYAELKLSDQRVFGQILRNVESVKGAAVMGATEPQEPRPRKGAEE